MPEFIEVPISLQGADAKHQLRLFATQRILELLSAAGGKSLERQFVEGKILDEFRNAGRWHPDLSAVIKKQSKTHAQNMIHWARGDLSNDGIIYKSDGKSGRYVLCCNVKALIDFYEHEKAFGFEAIVARGELRKRTAKLFRDSDSVYIILDPRHPGWCKVGAGRGSCVERLAEAKRWTRREAKLVYVITVGPGLGRNVESAAHGILRKKYEKQLEWFRCSSEDAKEHVRRAVLQTKGLLVSELGPEEISRIDHLANAELHVIE